MPVKSLSGGQRQAVAIARAVHFNARILIMDEPTAALGPAETAQVRDLIRQLKDEGIGIFLISHDIHDVFDLSDRISVMYHGRIVDTVNKTDVTTDEVLGMIILGKRPTRSPRRSSRDRAARLTARAASAAAQRVGGRSGQGGIELPIDRVRVAVGRARRRPGAGDRRRSATSGRDRRRRPSGNQPAPDRGEQRRAVRRALGRRDGRDLGLEHVGEDLPPQRARDAAAGRAHLVGARHAGRDHQVEPVAQPERHALEDRARRGGAGRGRAVSPTNAPRASGSGCGLRSPLR